MSGWRRHSKAIRLIIGAAVMVFLVWRVGAAPFIAGLRKVDAQALAAALVIGVITTVCCAWRWRAVSRGLGAEVPMTQATAAYYRSVFLNSTLPGGVVGDVHRAVQHGQATGDVGRGVRSVAWERSAGQIVQITITVIALLLLPSPIRSWMPAALTALLFIGLVAVVLHGSRGRLGDSRPSRILRTAFDDVRSGVLAREAWPIVIGASVIVVAGHAATFVIAARTAGTDASTMVLLPLALIVLAAMAIPLSIAGWGPREGVAAWTFAAAGLGAAAGITTAVVYAVMALVATLPGAAILLASSLRHRAVPTEEVVHG